MFFRNNRQWAFLSYINLIAYVFQTVTMLIQQGTCACCKSSCKRRMIEISYFCRRQTIKSLQLAHVCSAVIKIKMVYGNTGIYMCIHPLRRRIGLNPLGTLLTSDVTLVFPLLLCIAFWNTGQLSHLSSTEL